MGVEVWKAPLPCGQVGGMGLLTAPILGAGRGEKGELVQVPGFEKLVGLEVGRMLVPHWHQGTGEMAELTLDPTPSALVGGRSGWGAVAEARGEVGMTVESALAHPMRGDGGGKAGSMPAPTLAHPYCPAAAQSQPWTLSVHAVERGTPPWGT